VDDEVVIVRVEELVPLIEVGVKAAVAPVGKPDALKLTLPLKPSRGELDTV
jgi:hypothetical protein